MILKNGICVTTQISPKYFQKQVHDIKCYFWCCNLHADRRISSFAQNYLVRSRSFSKAGTRSRCSPGQFYVVRDNHCTQTFCLWTFQRDLAAISDQVEAITKEAERLIGLFPDAQEHIATKHEEMVQAWNNLVEKATLRKDKLQQAEQIQMYFNDYRELRYIVEWLGLTTLSVFEAGSHFYETKSDRYGILLKVHGWGFSISKMFYLPSSLCAHVFVLYQSYWWINKIFKKSPTDGSFDFVNIPGEMWWMLPPHTHLPPLPANSKVIFETMACRWDDLRSWVSHFDLFSLLPPFNTLVCSEM